MNDDKKVFYGLGRKYNKGNEKGCLLIEYKGEIFEYEGFRFGIGYRSGMEIIELSTGLSCVSVNTHLKGYEEAKQYIVKHFNEIKAKFDFENGFKDRAKEYKKLLKKKSEVE